MGTPEFAVPSLKILLDNGYTIAGVVTAPDKPAGRGQQIHESPVKTFAREHYLTILQPEKLKAPDFLKELQSLKADLQVVVAFRMLPKVVWDMPTYGTFNLHASLLPQYRGAAPINWAIINGEKKTGITTFFIEEEIDTGKVIFQVEVPIEESQTAGDIHDILMKKGAQLVLKTVNAINENKHPATDQSNIASIQGELKPAPKIFKEDCKINWNKPLDTVYNLIRGLSPYPAAWTELKLTDGSIISFKIFNTSKIRENHNHSAGAILSDNRKYFKVAVPEGFIEIHSLQMAGKRRMQTEEFLRGFQNLNMCTINT